MVCLLSTNYLLKLELPLIETKISTLKQLQLYPKKHDIIATLLKIWTIYKNSAGELYKYGSNINSVHTL